MVKNPPDERLVYLTLKGIFQGEKAKFRREKIVRKAIQEHKNEVGVLNLTQEYTIDSISHVAKCLLEDQIFESTLKAKLRFPEVFEVSPAQTAERAISESEAARNEDAAIQNVMGEPIIEISEDEIVSTEPANGVIMPHISESPSPSTSLYPVYLPFNIHHRLLVRVQQELEQACYIFAQKRLGGVLQREGWDCPEAVELNRWTYVFRTYQDEFSADDLKHMTKSLPELLQSIAQIRHAAVHRLRMTANRALQFMVDAESLVNLFQNDDLTRRISTIRRQTRSTIEDLERNKDMLELRQAETRKRFAAKRVELDLQEREAIESITKEDNEYDFFAGVSLEQSLLSPATVIHSTELSTGGESSSETEFDDCSIADTISA